MRTWGPHRAGVSLSSPEPALRGAYGVDAPPALWGLAVVGTVLVAAAAVAAMLGVAWLAVILGIAAVWFLVSFGFFLYTTRRGKFRVWADILSGLGLRGDERVLDAGCGRGMVLAMASRRLTQGRAVGIDLWRSVDQSGNDIEATRRNATAEGVADRVELHTGDLREMPFPDGSFDLALSSLVIHNIHDDRRRAVAEMVRVLRPGGRVAIVDLGPVREYPAWLQELGVRDVQRRNLGPRFWYSPFLGASLVTGTVPDSRDSRA